MTPTVIQADCLEYARSLPDGAVDLTFGSPPYEAARTYGIDFKLRGQDWVDWMVERMVEFVRVTNGLVAMVLEGQTRNYRWSAVPALLMADLHRRGIHLRKPPIFKRVGIPGSGGPDWLRNDFEWIICCTKGGKLPWSDNTAMGHPPKWAPGGAMSHRLTDGSRRDKWGRDGSTGNRDANGNRKPQTNAGVTTVPCGGCGESKEECRCIGCQHEFRETKVQTRRKANGEPVRDGVYTTPVLANPGNVIDCLVGGGVMGSPLAHLNEAPFPADLAEFFIRSFCRPGGIVFDPYSGSGTTGQVAVQCGRRFIGTDIRASQVELTKRRLASVQKAMF